MARHIKQGDTVMVIAGADKGRTGKVLRLVTKTDRVVIEGINRVWKHVKPTQRNPRGSRIQKEAPIHLSNVMPVEPGSGKPTRVRFSTAGGGKKRVSTRGTELGTIVKA